MTLSDASAITSAQPGGTSSRSLLTSPRPSADISIQVSNLMSSPQKPASRRSNMSSGGKGKGRAEEEPLVSDSEPAALLGEVYEQEDERSDREVSDTEDEYEDEDEDNYEEERQRRIRENQLILANLGIQSSSSLPNVNNAAAGPSTPPAVPAPRRKKTASNAPIYDRSGYIISLPAPGETHTIACVEMPSDRKLKRRILEGEYTDCSAWAKGEERRWKIGRGKGGELPPEEPWYLGGVRRDFRWRKWKGLEKELRREMRLRGELNDRDTRATAVETAIVVPEGVSAYSLIPGQACHQCRRKSDKRKMKCRNVNPVCNATFCETCCKRYSYFDFDEESRSFICPLCKDICNCSNCIRKRNLAHLLEGKSGVKRSSIKNRMGPQAQGEMTVQAWLEQAVKENLGAPFDCVRLVDQSYDVITPDLPPEEQVQDKIVVSGPSKVKKVKKTKVKLADQIAVEVGAPGEAGEQSKKGKSKKKRKDNEENGDGNTEGKPKAKRGRPKKVVDDEEEVTNSVTKANDRQEPSGPNKLVVKLKIPKPADVTASTTQFEHAERVKEVDSDGDTVGDWSSDGGSSKLTSLSSKSQSPVSPAPPPRLPFPTHPKTSRFNGSDGHPLFYPSLLQSEPNDIQHGRQLPYDSSPSDGRAVHVSPFRSSPESADDPEQPAPKRRKKPPPEANIIRAPRHSFSQSESSPVKSQSQPEPVPKITSTYMAQTYSEAYQGLAGPQKQSNSEALPFLAHPMDQRQYQALDPGSITLPAFSQGDHTLHLESCSGPQSYPKSDASLDANLLTLKPSSHTFWQPRSPLSRWDDSAVGLAPGPEQAQNSNGLTGEHGKGPSEIQGMAMPMDYSYSNGGAGYTSAYGSPYGPHHAPGPMGGGPPPYSHSPTRRPMTLSPGMAGQYLSLDRSPLSSDQRLIQANDNGNHTLSPSYSASVPGPLAGPGTGQMSLSTSTSTTLTGPYSSLLRPGVTDLNALPMDYGVDRYGPPDMASKYYDHPSSTST
ncbi:hypothetical protein IAU59_000928 [Kwoniella sp. CBS 9459]